MLNEDEYKDIDALLQKKSVKTENNDNVGVDVIKSDEIKLDENKLKDIDKLIASGVIRERKESESSLGMDLQEIMKMYNADVNVFKYGYFKDIKKIGYFSLLQAIGDKPFIEKEEQPRYAFVRKFLYYYSVNMASLKSAQAERFKEIASALLSFRGAIEYREAGVSSFGTNQKEHSWIDKLKKGKE